MIRFDRIQVTGIEVMRSFRKRGTRAQMLSAKVVCLAGCGLLMAFVGWRLFSGITVVGMQGYDTFVYWNEAEQMFRGLADVTAGWPMDCQLSRVCATAHIHADRLSFYALNLLAFQLFGINDYALRAGIGIAAVLNVALLFYLCYYLARNLFVALSAAAIYATNPVILFYSGVELPHIYGVTFILLGTTFALYAIDQALSWSNQLLFSGLAGFFFALAVFTHEDLIFLAVAIAALIGVMHPCGLISRPWHGLLVTIKLVLIFCLGFGIAIAFPMLLLGVPPSKVIHDLFALTDVIQGSMEASRARRLPSQTMARLFENVAIELLQPFLFTMTLLGTAAVGLAYVKSPTRSLKPVLMLGIASTSYTFLFAIMQIFLVSNYKYTRVFIPIATLVIAFTVSSIYLGLRSLLALRLWRIGATVLATAVTVAGSSVVVLGYHPAAYGGPQISPVRQIYDSLRDVVTAQRRLLLPGCFPTGAQTEQVGLGGLMYLGEGVVVLVAHPVENFDSFVRDYSVRYVFLPRVFGIVPIERDQLERLFSVFYNYPLPADVAFSIDGSAMDGVRSDQVLWTQRTCELERQALLRNLDLRGARNIRHLPLGDLYELPANASDR